MADATMMISFMVEPASVRGRACVATRERHPRHAQRPLAWAAARQAALRRLDGGVFQSSSSL